jgi:hypothetical protein
MDLPERTKQRKAESASYAILLYKLRDIGIFRNLTENDYGIDFEIELVLDESVTGRYFKAQVKSAEEVHVRKSDDVPTVSGIKQSNAELLVRTQLQDPCHRIRCGLDDGANLHLTPALLASDTPDRRIGKIKDNRVSAQ